MTRRLLKSDETLSWGQDVLLRLNAEGHITWCSPNCAVLFGAERPALLGTRLIDWVASAQHARFAELHAAPPLSLSEGPLHNLIKIRRGDGAPMRLRIQIRTIHGAGGQVTGYLDRFSDGSLDFEAYRAVRRARRAERTARSTVTRLNHMLDSAADVIVQYDPDGQIQFISAACRRLGWDPKELIGRSVFDLTDPESRTVVKQRLTAARAPRPGPMPVIEFKVRRKDGGWLWMEGAAFDILDDQGRRTAVASVLRDIEARKALQTGLVFARDKAEAAAAAQSEFLATMSHELRTPLTSVIGFSQLLMNEPDLPDHVRRSIDRIAAGGKALLATVNNVLDYSRIEAGDIAVEPAPTDIDSLVRETADLLRLRADEKGLELLLSGLEALPPMVRLDGNRLRQVLLNLLGNAVKFTDEGQVEIRCRYDAEPGLLTVGIVDSGIGMDAAQQEGLFKRFSQVGGGESRRRGGTGLGLAITRGLVEAMGGRVWVESAPGKGSSFWIEAPAPVCAAESLPGAEQAQIAAGLRALIVDDSAANRDVIAAILQQAGLESDKACEGLEAIDACGRKAYDVIIMDLRMPGLSGVDTARLIRRGGGPNRYAPILLCSADGAAPNLDAASLFDGFVCKPVAPANLIGRVAAVIDQDPTRLAETG